MPGKLDIRSSTVSHTADSVVFQIRTYNTWTPASLQDDSFLLLQIDKNNDRRYERCAVIFFASRLRSVLTNCGRTLIRNLPVRKPNAATVRTTIPKSQTGLVHWWANATYWEGVSPCRNGCVDFVPNRFPDILHDLVPPTLNMSGTTLSVWEVSTTTSFNFPFTVSDANSGIKSWRIQRRAPGTPTWSTVLSGTAGGSKNPLLAGEAGHWMYRVVVVDKQGNSTTQSRPVYVPTDIDDLTGAGSFTGSATHVDNAEAFGGGLVSMEAEGDTYEVQYIHPGGPCREFKLIGPGTGTWVISSTQGNKHAVSAPDVQRATVFSQLACSDTTYTFSVIGGSGFGVDAVLI